MAFLDGFQKTNCANPECALHTETRGGKFRMVDGRWFCERCAPGGVIMEPGKNRFDFVTTHFDGTPVHVKGLAHLRQLEKQYGVSNHAANYDEKHW